MRRPWLLQPLVVLPVLGVHALGSISAPACANFPTFVWGGHRDYLGAVNGYEPASLGHDELTNMVHGFNDHPLKPEVAVVVVLPSTFQSRRPDRDSFPALHKAMTSSPSSMVIPCVTRSSQQSLEDLIVSSPASQSMTVGPEDLVAHVNSRPASFSDGKLDVIITSFPSDVTPVEVNQKLEEVSQALERSVPHGRYLVFQTSEFMADHPTGGVRRKLAAPQRRLAVSKPYYETQYVYVTPNILAGLLTIVLFFVIVYIGVGCLASLQTPSKFIHARIPEGKEF